MVNMEDHRKLFCGQNKTETEELLFLPHNTCPDSNSTTNQPTKSGQMEPTNHPAMPKESGVGNRMCGQLGQRRHGKYSQRLITAVRCTGSRSVVKLLSSRVTTLQRVRVEEDEYYMGTDSSRAGAENVGGGGTQLERVNT